MPPVIRSVLLQLAVLPMLAQSPEVDLATSGHQALMAGDLLRAELQLTRALAKLRRGSQRSPVQEAAVLSSLVTLHLQAGEMSLAVNEARTMTALLASQPESRLQLAAAFLGLAAAEQGAGARDASREALDQALQLMQSAPQEPEYAAVRLNIALWLGANKDPKLGLSETLVVMPLMAAHQQKFPLLCATAYWRAAELAVLAGDKKQAEIWLGQSLSLLRQMPAAPVLLLVDVLTEQGNLLRKSKHKDEARAALEEAARLRAALPVWQPQRHRIDASKPVEKQKRSIP